VGIVQSPAFLMRSAPGGEKPATVARR